MDEKVTMFIERIGVRSENMGFPPLAGRIFGCLLLADPPYMTFEELCERLGASKSTISNNLQFLMRGDCMIDYFTLPGDRKRYFKINTDNWIRKVQAIPEDVKGSNELIEEIMAFRRENNLDESFTKNLEIIHSFHEFIIEKMPDLIREWKIKNKIS